MPTTATTLKKCLHFICFVSFFPLLGYYVVKSGAWYRTNGSQ